MVFVLYIFLLYFYRIFGQVEVYISLSGDDTNGTGELDAPFATVQRAVEMLQLNNTQEETTIYLFPGEYTDQTLLLASNTSLSTLNLRPLPANTTTNSSTEPIPTGPVKFQSLFFNITQNVITFYNISMGNFAGNLNSNDYNVWVHLCEIGGVNIQTADKILGIVSFVDSMISGNMNFVGQTVVINNCYLKGLELAEFTALNMTLSNSIYSDNLSPLKITSIITFITNCTFSNNSGYRAGALHLVAFIPPLQEPQSGFMILSLFANNTAYGNGYSIGPACLLEVDTYIMNTMFSCNKLNSSASFPPIADGPNHILIENANYDSACEPLCPKGQYSLYRMIQCKSCFPGTITNTTTADQCIICDKGQSTNAMWGQDKCSPCAPGTYATFAGSARCTNCHPGTFTAGQGTITCEKCAAGTYQPENGQVSCHSCEKGSVSTEGSSTCKVCGQGSYVSMGKCVDCDMWFTSNPGSLDCNAPSWRMYSLIGGMVAVVVFGCGVFVIQSQKRRPGYWAVRSWRTKNSAVLQ